MADYFNVDLAIYSSRAKRSSFSLLMIIEKVTVESSNGSLWLYLKSVFVTFDFELDTYDFRIATRSLFYFLCQAYNGGDLCYYRSISGVDNLTTFAFAFSNGLTVNGDDDFLEN